MLDRPEYWRTREFDVRYSYRLTCQASGDCFPDRGGDVVVMAPNASVGTGGIIVAPSAPLRFEGGRVATHQLMIGVPLR